MYDSLDLTEVAPSESDIVLVRESEEGLVDFAFLSVCKLRRFTREACGNRLGEDDEIARRSMISDKALDELEVSRDIIPMDTALYCADS